MDQGPMNIHHITGDGSTILALRPEADQLRGGQGRHLQVTRGPSWIGRVAEAGLPFPQMWEERT